MESWTERRNHISLMQLLWRHVKPLSGWEQKYFIVNHESKACCQCLHLEKKTSLGYHTLFLFPANCYQYSSKIACLSSIIWAQCILNVKNLKRISNILANSWNLSFCIKHLRILNRIPISFSNLHTCLINFKILTIYRSFTKYE